MHKLYELSKNNMFLTRHVKLDGTVHYHEEIKLVYVTSGKMNVHVGNTEYILGPDTLLVVFPKQIHKFRSDSAPDEASIMFLFDPAILPELSDAFATSVPQTAASTDFDFNRSVLPVMKLITEPEASDDAGREEYDCVAARGGLLLIMRKLCEKLGLVPAENQDTVMLAILEHCAENYRGKITLESMEQSLSLNGCYISTLFMRRLGMGFHDYINSLRLSDACRFLTTTGESVSKIATDVGFGTSRTFNRVFLENFGMSPREYRIKFSVNK
ncbi:MAG: AraC family transcriptional regulator [Clostridia bacterium]|nr:AraC family transcriptional regulator [Clostridia bacterium]MDY3784558.1 AraC family transcriptional regulator [Eubacteriales bacterium]